MNEKTITGVRVYVLTVDSETNTVLKCEEEDPNTHRRTELDPNFKLVPALILVGGQVPAVSSSKEGKHEEPFGIQPHTGSQPHGTQKEPLGIQPHIGPPGAPARQKKAPDDKQADKGGPPKV